MIFNLSNKIDLERAKMRFKTLLESGKVIELKEVKKKRTNKQNAALHLYFKYISDALTELGQEFTYEGVKGMDISMPYNPEIVKEFFWRPIQRTLFDKESTTELNTKEIDKIIDIVNKFFAEKGIDIVFPSYESLLDQLDF